MADKLMFISRWFPFPPDNGSKLRVFHLLKRLADQYELHLVSFFHEGEDAPAAMDELSSICASVQVIPYPGYHPTQMKALLGFFSPVPRSVIATRSTDMEAVTASLARQHQFDLVIASQIDMAPYALSVDAKTRVLEELEITGYLDAKAQQRSMLGRLRWALTLSKSLKYFSTMATRFDGVTVVSQRELREISKILPRGSCLELIPNGADLSSFDRISIPPEPGMLIYPGSVTYSANLDAVRYFVESILPEVIQNLSDVDFFVTGKTNGVPLGVPPFTNAGVAKRVHFTGYLADVREQIARSWICVVPVRKGGGTRLKILESLALGTPVISTSKGAEGLELAHGRDILIADHPKEFAAQIVRLLADPDLRAQLSEQGRQTVIQRYDWDKIGAGFIKFLETLRTKQRKS